MNPSPIRRKLMKMILLTSGTVLLLTSAAFLTYEFVNFRSSAARNLKTLGQVIATNSTAALAFQNPDDAAEIMSALKAEPHVVVAALYDKSGALFAAYPADTAAASLPVAPPADGYRFENSFLIGLQPVELDGRRLGTLYLKSDMNALYEWLKLYGWLSAVVIGGSLMAAYLISRSLQRQISQPILDLAGTARAISERRDYSVRASRPDGVEFGLLTDAFNHMLERAQEQLGRLDLLRRITRAIGERQDLPSIYQVVLRRLEEDLPVDFACVLLRDTDELCLVTTAIGERSVAVASQVGLAVPSRLAIEANGFARALAGELAYEPDIASSRLPLLQKLAQAGLQSLVIAPLRIETYVFGVLFIARGRAEAFTSADCEFLHQLSEHVGLASHQAQLYGALQKAYEELRQSQQTALQQERLRALGQMASGIAHDINNAISPVALYTDSLLEREPNLSDRARGYLTTIRQAIEDVASTVGRMREFYRPRESQLVLGAVRLNPTIQQVVTLTHARWFDEPQQRGAVIKLELQLDEQLPYVMGADSEIRDALTNLIFNAVDAMPDGGTLTLRTRVIGSATAGLGRQVCLEVSDTGVGMDEETRRRCLEPFYTTKGEQGTGLGLAMVYGMVQRHSAELQIDSAPGKGTTVRLVFTVSEMADGGTTQIRQLHIPLRPRRVLIIDDDPMLIQSLRDALEGDGHSITTADGGQKGIDACISAHEDGTPFDLVITDLGMPYVDGRKVAAAIHAACPAIPIVMLTGWGQRLLAEDDMPPHVQRVLNKPPRLQELRAALADLTQAAA